MLEIFVDFAHAPDVITYQSLRRDIYVPEDSQALYDIMVWNLISFGYSPINYDQFVSMTGSSPDFSSFGAGDDNVIRDGDSPFHTTDIYDNILLLKIPLDNRANYLRKLFVKPDNHDEIFRDYSEYFKPSSFGYYLTSYGDYAHRNSELNIEESFVESESTPVFKAGIAYAILLFVIINKIRR
tara:strand:+ start:1511 stop:2059 length:549 start_codon:yes stop_codon:yes gene_type:complete